MKVIETSCGGYIVKVNVPSTYEEHAQMAKDVNAALDAAIDKEIAHGTLGEIRSAVEGIITDEYKISRRDVGQGTFEGEGDSKVENTKPEKWEVYLARAAVEANLTGDFPWQHVFSRVSSGGDKEVKFDPSVRERKAPQPPKPAKKDIEGATAFLAKASEKAISSFIAHAKKVANFELVHTGEKDKDIQAFARAAQAIRSATNVFEK